MGNRVSDKGDLSLASQIAPFVVDPAARGRIKVDLADMREACAWYLNALVIAEERRLTRDELESLLIGIEVNVLRHLAFHLDSFMKDLPEVLDAIAQTDDDT
jgi:hypothetical protein